jgi:2-polyprenyl-3-methyl-5-hydroxy-6-metoxy-1,4-benzoquinol methylase
MRRESLVEFYRRHEISPVRQDITDLTRHFTRRRSLYRHLGLLEATFEGRRVVEVGPGSGMNSLYTASLRPATYDLVEGNPAGVKDIEALFARFPDLSPRLAIHPVLLEHFQPDASYDVVLCEGMLAGFAEPVRMLRQLMALVRPGGVLVVTCTDDLSILAEVVRNFLGQLLLRDMTETDLATAAQRLLAVFGPHLDALPAMSRRREDWIVDNIVNPSLLGSVLSIADAIGVAGDEFDVHGSVPRFLVDWRWYKALDGSAASFNELALGQYWSLVHNFVRHDALFAARPADDNRALYALATGLRESCLRAVESHDAASIASVRATLRAIAGNVRTFSLALADALDEAADLTSERPDPDAIARSRKFGPVFGRGMQYLSLVRRCAHVVPSPLTEPPGT